MTKLTVAKKNEILRGLAMQALGLDKAENLLQVAGSKYAIDVEFEGEWYPVRIDIVVPKVTEDDVQSAQDMHEEYASAQAQKEADKQAKAEAKAKKIARDEKLRAEKRAAKEAAKAKKEEK